MNQLPRAAPTFQAKYGPGNAVARRLVEGFFRSLARAIESVQPVGRALEVACGEGVSTERIRALLPPGALLHASDINRQRLRAARQRNPTVPIVEESIYHLARPDQAYDLVLALEVMEHLGDPRRALAEVCRVSRRWVVCSVPREPVWRALNVARLKYVGALGNTPGHVNHWSTRSFARFVAPHLDVRTCLTPLPWTIIVGEVRR